MVLFHPPPPGAKVKNSLNKIPAPPVLLLLSDWVWVWVKEPDFFGFFSQALFYARRRPGRAPALPIIPFLHAALLLLKYRRSL